MISVTFIIAAVILAITPGPGIAYVIARTAAGGRKEGFASCIGTGLGGFVHVIAAAFGISVVVAKSALAFSMIKYIGVAYLIYLGIRIFVSNKGLVATAISAPQGVRKAFAEGVLVETFNVKTALFFLAFLPQFTTPEYPLAIQLILLGSVCVLLNTFIDFLVVLLSHRLMSSSHLSEKRERILTRTSALTMIGLGTYLAIFKKS
jgi:threonine/homoserine/homoserine lactone efflux protein